MLYKIINDSFAEKSFHYQYYFIMQTYIGISLNFKIFSRQNFQNGIYKKQNENIEKLTHSISELTKMLGNPDQLGEVVQKKGREFVSELLGSIARYCMYLENFLISIEKDFFENKDLHLIKEEAGILQDLIKELKKGLNI
ncbi:MAG: hypothetical protein PHV30_08975 [Candidatus Margulisbacteria bacterium]|nr:hypothetical protein [Candidatus Margulisiibacteriota bacterium]